MAEMPSPSTATAPKRTTSKMALMLSFAAGAAFSWILISMTDDEPMPAPPGIILVQQR